ncbi:hypothetical protein QFC22_006292 [Naganishia vaughanmartiniae]|uniref:Uncharacterized protein n=1 Tax=Naganishia vaughanmartiniae TaxID=1424756 RepID=A0ACC2WMH4_9TREE|nr:hypothetical protein QFC22_006292 [Naganishia vaughanmartiniae]
MSRKRKRTEEESVVRQQAQSDPFVSLASSIHTFRSGRRQTHLATLGHLLANFQEDGEDDHGTTGTTNNEPLGRPHGRSTAIPLRLRNKSIVPDALEETAGSGDNNEVFHDNDATGGYQHDDFMGSESGSDDDARRVMEAAESAMHREDDAMHRGQSFTRRSAEVDIIDMISRL